MSAAQFRPLFDRVLVRREKAETKTKFGLFVPESSQEAPDAAVVVAVGPGRIDKLGKQHPVGVKPGDKVLLGKWGGEELKLGGVDHLVVRESDLFAVLED
jgi:chaperonin GroES